MENKETFPAMMQEAADLTPIVVKPPIIVFKGKIVGETEETIFTSALIEEKSKPLLALKINGIFDTEGAEAIKKAINKAVKMRTAVEGQADPFIKSINAQAKKDVEEVRSIAKPIYDACYATQNALQAKFDTWQTDVNRAKQKESDGLKAKTEGRDASMYAAGMQFNGNAFTGHGKMITKEMLHGMKDEPYAILLEEIALANEAAQIAGKEPEPVAPAPVRMSYGGGVSWPSSSTPKAPAPAAAPMDIIYSTTIPELGARFFITNGMIEAEPDAYKANDDINGSGYYAQITR